MFMLTLTFHYIITLDALEHLQTRMLRVCFDN